MSNGNGDYRKRPGQEMNRVIDDPCAIQQRGIDSAKKLKFVTTNHIDLINARSDMNFFGIGVKDQLFVPTDAVDTYSSLRNGERGGTLTNCNVKYGFGQLPVPTLPSRHQLYHGDVDIEDSMRNEIQSKRNACLPRDPLYHDRHFTIFDPSQGIEIPDATKSVDPAPRGGEPSRFTFSRK